MGVPGVGAHAHNVFNAIGFQVELEQRVHQLRQLRQLHRPRAARAANGEPHRLHGRERAPASARAVSGAGDISAPEISTDKVLADSMRATAAKFVVSK